MKEASVTTVTGNAKIIEGSGRANISMPMGTQLEIVDALYSPKSQRNLLSFKDIRRNGYHIETMSEGSIKYLQITSNIQGSKNILEKLLAFSTGLYYTTINTIEVNAIVNQKSTENIKVWHDRISVEHPVAHVHTQNGLAESLIKRLQLIARPLLMKSKLPISAWGHAILHAAGLVRIRPTSNHKFSPSQLVLGCELKVQKIIHLQSLANQLPDAFTTQKV
ncbi:retroelement pol polyprotein-like [Arabidopsis thaliana]|uniref:Retroelement pol polyprotein-like n=1 Tax=Arabidopsis thaliana TaxID=3702 RepID=Q9LI97_ARATH|nr:retroelement pol polyprotein-like [Arabidopsis thaliana]